MLCIVIAEAQITDINLKYQTISHYPIIAECLSARYLIPLHCQIVFVCMYIRMYICIYLCPAARASAVRYGSLPHKVHASAHVYFDYKWHVLVRCVAGRYSIKYIHTGVEGHSKARQRLARGIPVLQRIPSI